MPKARRTARRYRPARLSSIASALDAPVLAEVKRQGVTFARVYDVRGRPTPNLLTLPPP